MKKTTFLIEINELVLDELSFVMISDEEYDMQYELDLAELSTYIAAALTQMKKQKNGT